MKIHLEDCEAFLAIVIEKNFARAAKRLELSPSMLTRRINRLETTLKTRLFQRTTRSVSLTHEGELLFPRLNHTLESLADIETLFETETEELHGLIRLTAPVVYSQQVLPNILAKFRRLHPQVTLELIATDSVLNLIEEQVDIAIRMQRKLTDSSFIARQIAANPIIACAAPQYLEQAPRLSHPLDLHQHSVLFMDVHKRLAFINTDITLEQLADKRPISSNNGLVLTELALQGMGVLMCSLWDVREHLRAGELRLVLDMFPVESGSSAWLLFPSRHHLPKRIRVLSDYLIDHLSDKSTDKPKPV